MARLPTIDPGLVVTPQAPSSVSAGEVAAANRPAPSPAAGIAEGLFKLGGVLSGVGDNMERALAAKQLVQESQNARNFAQQALIDARGNVDTFDASMKAFADKRIASLPKRLRDRAGADYAEVAGSTRRQIVADTTERDLKSSKDVLNTEIDYQSSVLATLARAGKGNSPEFQAALVKRKQLYDELVANPLYGVSKDQVDLELRHDEGRLAAEASIGKVTSTYRRSPWVGGGGPAAMREIAKIRSDPRLSDAERIQYGNIAEGALRDEVATDKATLDSLKVESARISGLIDADINKVSADQVSKLANAMALVGGQTDAAALITNYNRARYLKAVRDAGPAAALDALTGGAPAAAAAAPDVVVADADGRTPDGIHYGAETLKKEGYTFDGKGTWIGSAPGAEPGTIGGYKASMTISATDFLLRRLEAGHTSDAITGMRPELQSRLAALFEAAPPGMRDKLQIISGYRTTKRQAELFAAAVKKYGSVDAARKWVAPPGNSAHNMGVAADLGYGGSGLGRAPKEVVAWLHENAPKFGLKFPLGNENWHIELTETRGGGTLPGGPAGGDPIVRVRNAIASIESAGSGDYSALGPVLASGDRAYGRYGVMGANIPAWTKAALGKTLTPAQFLADPKAQDAVFDYQFGQLVQKHGNVLDAASVWFTGLPRGRGASSRSDVLGTSGDEYVRKFAAALEGGSTGGFSYDPAVIKALRADISADITTHLSSWMEGLTRGGRPSIGDLNLVADEVAALDDPGKRNEFASFVQTYQDGALIADLPKGEGDALIARIKAGLTADGRDGLDLVAQKYLDGLQKMQDYTQTQLKADPLQFAADRNSTTLVPLDFSNADVLAAALMQRGRIGAEAEQRWQLPVTPALTKADQDAVKGYWQSADTGKKLDLLSTLVRGIPNRDRLMATLGTFADKADTGTLAIAGALAATNPEAAAAVVRGEAALAVNPKFGFDPGNQEDQTVRSEYFPSTTVVPGLEGAWQAHLDAARAAYADASNRVGDTSGKFDEDRWRQAVDLVTGGLVTFNGQKIITPRPDIDQRRFDDVLANLPSQALLGAITPDGTPIPRSFLLREGVLRGYGDGRYALEIGGTGVYALLDRGANRQTGMRDLAEPGPFVLDLRPWLDGKPPAAPAASAPAGDPSADFNAASGLYQEQVGAGNAAPPPLDLSGASGGLLTPEERARMEEDVRLGAEAKARIRARKDAGK